ncbi:MAG: alpha/beta hydrolase [Chloroflexota bacterium]
MAAATSPSPAPSSSPAAGALASPSATPSAVPSAALSPTPSTVPSPTPSTGPCVVVDLAGPGASGAPDVTTVIAAKPHKAIKPGRVRAKLDVAMTRRLPCYEYSTGCINRADIYYPQHAARWPTIVTIHGRPRLPSDMRELAYALAARGAVVFNADYRGVRPVSKGFPESISDVACAIRYARAHTAQYGGDPDHIVLVGHSYGGYVGMMVSVAGNRFLGRKGDCLVEKGSSLPNGFVHVAGVSITKASEPLDVIYFGGPQWAIPDVWRRGNVFHQIDVGGNRKLRVGIFFELHDPFLGVAHALWLRDALRRNGYHVRMELREDGWTHFDVLDMDRDLGEDLLEFTWSVVKKTAPAPKPTPKPTPSPSTAPSTAP